MLARSGMWATWSGQPDSSNRAPASCRRLLRAVDSPVDRANDATRIACGETVGRHIPRDDAAGADHGAGPDPHAGEDECAAPDPHVGANLDRLPVLLTPALLRVHRVERRQNLHAWAKERVITDAHEADVEDDAVEVEEHALAEIDVRAVVAEERRLHPDRVAAT